MTTGTLRRQRSGNGAGEPVTKGPGRAVGTPDSLLRDTVSTVLTLAGPTSVRPADIVEILRFLSGVQRRYAFNVSTMDTSDLPGLFLRRFVADRTVNTPPRRSVLEPESASSTPKRRSSHRAGSESSNERGLRPANRSEPPSQSSPGKDLS